MRAPAVPTDQVEVFRLFLRVAGKPANKITGEPRGKPTHPRVFHSMMADPAWAEWVGVPPTPTEHMADGA